MDVPRFDGEHPKLWQIQCEDYFEMYETSPVLWVRLASLQFIGPATRHLSNPLFASLLGLNSVRRL
jgi:hypothetical protein